MRKRKWNVGRLLSGVMALLGFAGCNNGDEPCLYGSPSVDYRVLGTVTDNEGKPLEGIQVVVDNPGASTYYDKNGIIVKDKYESGKLTPDTVYTDKNGKFSSYKVEAFSDSKLVVEVQDIDGEANGGEFQSERFTKDKLDKKQLKKGNGWYEGEFEYSKTVKLERK